MRYESCKGLTHIREYTHMTHINARFKPTCRQNRSPCKLYDRSALSGDILYNQGSDLSNQTDKWSIAHGQFPVLEAELQQAWREYLHKQRKRNKLT